jgi:hypothetical protein
MFLPTFTQRSLSTQFLRDRSFDIINGIAAALLLREVKAARLKFGQLLCMGLFCSFLFLFLICSFVVLSSLHESSIFFCSQAPAGHGALRAGGCAF